MKNQGLGVIAFFEGAKGILSLIVAIGVNALVGEDLHQLALDMMKQWEVASTSEYAVKFLSFIDKISNNSLLLVTLIASIYGSSRFVLAYGLWHELVWVEWFAFISASLYIPFEIYAIYQDVNVISVAALLINLVIAGYLYIVLRRGMKAKNPQYV